MPVFRLSALKRIYSYRHHAHERGGERRTSGRRATGCTSLRGCCRDSKEEYDLSRFLQRPLSILCSGSCNFDRDYDLCSYFSLNVHKGDWTHAVASPDLHLGNRLYVLSVYSFDSRMLGAHFRLRFLETVSLPL